jgi:hypothetical protein
MGEAPAQRNIRDRRSRRCRQKIGMRPRQPRRAPKGQRRGPPPIAKGQLQPARRNPRRRRHILDGDGLIQMRLDEPFGQPQMARARGRALPRDLGVMVVPRLQEARKHRAFNLPRHQPRPDGRVARIHLIHQPQDQPP